MSPLRLTVGNVAVGAFVATTTAAALEPSFWALLGMLVSGGVMGAIVLWDLR